MDTFKNFFAKARKVFVYEQTGEGREGKKAAKGTGEKKEPPAPKTKIITLAELQKKSKALKVDHFEELIAPGEELTHTFETIFEKANIRPAKPEATIEWVADFVEMKECADMPHDDIRQMLLASMKASRVRPEDVLQDAVHRDLAMDRYEPFLQSRVTKAGENLQDEIVAAQSKIRDLEAKIDENRKKIAEMKAFFEAFKTEKIGKETRMAKAARYLTADEHVVSIGSVTEGASQDCNKKKP
jgi:hypothetical protein